MAEASPNPELMRSLGRLVRGLSALFWGLPAALIICFHTAKFDTLRNLGVLPPMACTGWLLYGLWHVGAFQPQERIWRAALERARIVGILLFGLSPFIFWWSRAPSQPLFTVMMSLAGLSGLLFLASLNLVLQRLGAMLPDEGLRLETRQFTALNLNLLCALLVLLVGGFALLRVRGEGLPPWVYWAQSMLERASPYLLIPLLLLPLAMTMALLWKTKEVILDSLFNRT